MDLEQGQQELLKIIGLVHPVIQEELGSALLMQFNIHGAIIEKSFQMLDRCLKIGLYQLHHDIL